MRRIHKSEKDCILFSLISPVFSDAKAVVILSRNRLIRFHRLWRVQSTLSPFASSTCLADALLSALCQQCESWEENEREFFTFLPFRFGSINKFCGYQNDARLHLFLTIMHPSSSSMATLIIFHLTCPSRPKSYYGYCYCYSANKRTC